MKQIHENFMFFRHSIDPAMNYSANLNAALIDLAGEFVAKTTVPRSFSIVTDPDEIIFSIGHNNSEAPCQVDFAVFRLGIEADSNQALEQRMEAAAGEVGEAGESGETTGDVLCHDIFRLPGDVTMWVLFMIRKGA